MKSLLPLTFLAALLLAGCEPTGQAQTAPGDLQMPGARAAASTALNIPPDGWQGPSRSAAPQTTQALRP